jgi:short-subunit dehydrogenase
MNIATQPGKGTAVITGASTGIGAIYANRLARMGYDLIIVARNHNRLNQMASHITADTARNVEVVAADLGDANNLTPWRKNCATMPALHCWSTMRALAHIRRCYPAMSTRCRR